MISCLIRSVIYDEVGFFIYLRNYKFNNAVGMRIIHCFVSLEVRVLIKEKVKSK